MSIRLSGLSVLVVDDNAQMRTIIGTILTGAGVGRVHHADNGRRALEVLKDQEIDIVFLDHEMPQMNGIQTLKALRRAPAPKCFAPVIMLTGHSDLSHIAAARDHGVNEFLGKPVTARALLARLEAVILQPRPFVEAGAFFGPDRRRRRSADGAFKRRASDRVEAGDAER